MPYIKQERRKDFDCVFPAKEIDQRTIKTPGELNYGITVLIKHYWERTGNYQGINDIVGALENCKLEFYRRIAVPFEEDAIKRNGDCY